MDAVTDEGEQLDVFADHEVSDDTEPENKPPPVAMVLAPPSEASAMVQAMVACHQANVEMARSLAGAVKSVAEAQADFVKGLGQRVVPKTIQVPIPMPVPAPSAEAAHETVQVDPGAPAWMQFAAQFVQQLGPENLAPLIGALPDMLGAVAGLFKRDRAEGVQQQATRSTPHATESTP